MPTLSIPSPLGSLVIESDGHAITRVAFGKRSSVETQNFASLRLEKRCAQELNQYFAGKRTRFTVPLKPEGTDFQQSVWHAMSKILYGSTKSYAQIAKIIGKPKAVRAVGSACGKNPIVILIPCHRVVGSNGGFGGYSGGIAKKKALLQLESTEQ